MKDIMVMLNEPVPYVSYRFISNQDIKSFNCVLGYCSWIVQPELLLSNNILIGLSYALPDEHVDWVSAWVEYKGCYHLRVVEIATSTYYKLEDYICKYIFEVRWNEQEPTTTVSFAITEDFWLISSDETQHPFDQIFAIGLTDLQSMAKDFGLTSTY